MFSRAERVVPLAWGAARVALEHVLAHDGLHDESVAAEAEGMGQVVPVGPLGTHGPTRDVVVRVLSPVVRPDELTLPIRWDVPGPTGWLYPALDAELHLTALDDATSRLEILARYEPPLGAVGRLADKVVMAKVATATMEAFLREVAARLSEVPEQGDVRADEDG